ncbi:hypothetical protein [Micromonospora echinospora]|uniref:hypothetical protein n=1 Tax=Micromonospora echinospora TaxID=1877 RepID=UPI003A838595
MFAAAGVVPSLVGPALAGLVVRTGWAYGAAAGVALPHHGGQQRGPLAVVLVVGPLITGRVRPATA